MSYDDAIAELEEQIKQQSAVIEQMRKSLYKLACLGNGDTFGNSIGNEIAQQALALQPCPEVLNKVRADAVRKAFKLMMDGRWRGDALDVLADRMERGEA